MRCDRDPQATPEARVRGMMRGGAAFLLGLTLAVCAIILVQSMLLPGTHREHGDQENVGQGSAAVLELRR